MRIIAEQHQTQLPKCRQKDYVGPLKEPTFFVESALRADHHINEQIAY